MLPLVGGVVVVVGAPAIEEALRAHSVAFVAASEEDLSRAIDDHDPDVVVIPGSAAARVAEARRGRRRIIVSDGAEADHVLDPTLPAPLLARFVELLSRLGAAERRADTRERRDADLRIALDAARIGTFELDLATMLVTWSDVTYELSGVSRERFDGRYETILTLIHEEDRPRIESELAKIREKGEPVATDFRLLGDDGAFRHIHGSATLVRDGYGKASRVIGTVVDVTERKRVELSMRRALEEMRESDERVRIVARATSDLVWDWDLVTDIVSWSDNLEALFGYKLTATPISWWEDVMHPEDRGRVADGIRAVIELGEESWADEYRMRRANGQYANVYDRGIVIFDDAGKPVRMIGAIMDITERRELQARLLLADRMASVGTLAAGVAHEINNPLAYVIANVDIAAQELRKRATPQLMRALDVLAEAKDGAERVRRIVGDLKTFSRADDAVRERVDLRDVVDSSINLAMNEIRHRARLVRELNEVPRVDANAGRLGQVVVNLLVNAAQAIPEGEANKNEIRVRTRTDGSGRAVLEVEDTGPGMPPDIRARIFDPFYTTKPVGEGTGLGLTICHGIIAALGGSIEVESDVGTGALFRVVLPPARESDRVTRSPVPSVAIATEPRQGRVLVVDDEPMIGRAVQLMLEDVHEVVPVVSARDALEQLERGEEYDAIVCDLMMPEMTGMDLYHELTRKSPHMAQRIVFLTGGAFTPRARAFLESVPNGRLEKPFDGAALMDAIAIAMRRGRAAVDAPTRAAPGS